MGVFVAGLGAVETNPNTDPHSFEASPSVASRIGAARLVVQNGLGYDSYMNTIESASANSGRRVIDVSRLLGLPSSTRNPHIWYRLDTMVALARALARALLVAAPAAGLLLQRERDELHSLAGPLAGGAQRLRRALPAHADRGDPSPSAITCSPRPEHVCSPRSSFRRM